MPQANKIRKLVFENGEVRYKVLSWNEEDNIPMNQTAVDDNIKEIDAHIAKLQKRKVDLQALKSQLSSVNASNPEVILEQS